MKKKEYYVMLASISLFFLILLTIVVFSFTISLKSTNSSISRYDTEPLYIYVNATTETETSPSEAWLVKEYKEKIGIYDSEGKLTQIIDTYVKTLPKLERDELREGIWLTTKDELYSIIEAYTD